MRTESVGENREGASCLRQLCFGEEKDEVKVFYRLKIRSKTTIVAEVNEEKVEEVSIHFGSQPREQSDLRTFLVSFPEVDFKARFGVARYHFFVNSFGWRDGETGLGGEDHTSVRLPSLNSIVISVSITKLLLIDRRRGWEQTESSGGKFSQTRANAFPKRLLSFGKRFLANHRGATPSTSWNEIKKELHFE
ncbi:hypothetical protein E2C01_051043 [Portunus trituberculatus]|uniref:Uncharacterized protein n=1 Tax=Portunus trituberculatus TaxID=210409 RepID=A0A5B7GAJ4_PORTR|nr:hypothetical protein [Portunus trituberculatus]